MKKLKLLFAACTLLLGVSNASADVQIETDLTSQFNSLATTQWDGSSGQVGWAAPEVTTNSGLTVAAWESYCGSWNGGCTNTGTIMKTNVTGLAPGTYKIELYGAAAFTFDRGFGSEAFTGDLNKAVSDTYTAGQSIETETGVVLYATTSEGSFSEEIPIWYADNFNVSGLSTAVLNGVVVGEDGNIEIGMSKTSKSTNWHVVQLKGVTATVSGSAAIDALKATATALLSNPTYANVTGSERTNLVEACGLTPIAETQEAYLAVISALNTAISAFEGCNVAAYDAFAAEKAKAAALGMDVSGYTATNAADAETKTQTIKVDEYTYVTTNYAYGVGLGAWSATGGTGTMTGQHWDGTTVSSYLEQSGENWGKDSWSIKYDQDVTLPAGNYVFKVAGRTANSNGVTMGLVVKQGESILGTVNDFPRGDVGLGINTSGVTDYTTGDGHNYANDNKGRGWEWRYVKFTLADPATVNVAVTASATTNHMWVGFCNPTVQTDDAENVALMEALVALNDAKTAATLTKYTNVGTGVFQYDETTNETLWSAYSTAKSNAEAYEFTSSSTAEEVNALATALNTAISNYQNQAVNAPVVGQPYVLSNTTAEGDLKVSTESVTVDKGGFVYFTAVEGGYVISNSENEYIFKLGENNWDLSTTTNIEEAYVVTVNFEGDGAYSIHGAKGYFGTDNTAAGSKVFANKAVSNNGKWTVSLLASTVSKNITDAGWATYCSPYALDFSTSGLTAYIVTGATGNVLTLTQVTSVPANTGVLLEGAADDYDISVVASSSTDVTANKLKGVTGAFSLGAGEGYVLLNGGKGVGFYSNPNEAFTVGANTAYLVMDNSAREAYFFDGLTEINQVENGEVKSALPVKRIVKGNLVIEKNGVSVNAAGVQLK